MSVLLAWLYRTFCRFSFHSFVFQLTGHNVHKECRFCKAIGAMTTEEWKMARSHIRRMERKMRVYIAGPMAGIVDGNRLAFKERAEQLRLAGHDPVNPWDIFPEDHEGPCIGGDASNETGHQYGCNLRADIAEMMFCDAISLLPGWENSKGASTEEHVARSLGIPVL